MGELLETIRVRVSTVERLVILFFTIVLLAMENTFMRSERK
jgi:hypothetical protein